MILNIRFILTFGLFLTAVSSRAQSFGTYKQPIGPLKGWEVSNNVTLALSRFTGNVTRNLNEDPYLIMVRKLDSTQLSAWRVGVNGFRRKTEDLGSNDFGGSRLDRISEENSASLVIGREWRRNLGMGFYAFGGVDTRFLWRQNNALSVQTDWVSSSRIEIATKAQEIGGSIGGFGGIAWRFHNRITLYTESILYAQYLQTERIFSVNGVENTLENKNSFSVIPMVPVALFLSIHF